MIVGIGTDIVDVGRIDAMLGRRGEALAQRLLSTAEFDAFKAHPAPARFLAKRFAAKEAALKALGTGLRNGMRWADISVAHDALGKPALHLAGVARQQADALGVNACHLSISDEQRYAVAFVILERG